MIWLKWTENCWTESQSLKIFQKQWLMMLGVARIHSHFLLDVDLKIWLVGYKDYIVFLCGINGSASVLLNYTGESCGVSTMNGTDLNMPSVTISKLNQSVSVQRTLTNIAANETYIIGWSAPNGVSMKVTPKRFFIAGGQQQILNVFLNATMNSTTPSFGRIGLVGNQGHVVNIPLSVIVKVSYHSTNSSWYSFDLVSLLSIQFFYLC